MTLHGLRILLDLIVLGYLALTLILIPPFIYLAVITATALLGRRVMKRPLGGPTGPMRIAFVIPAHNEEAGIGATIASCREVEYPKDQFRVVVIADNCTDQTAEAARLAGAEVLERTDPDHRGKGYALRHFFLADPPGYTDAGYDAVVVVDADTQVDRTILTAFTGRLATGQDWLQCMNTVGNSEESWRTQLLTLSFGLHNGIQLLGQDLLRMSVGLRGNGMCLSRRGLARHSWDAYGLTEDFEFSWMLRTWGERVRFVPETRVVSDMISEDVPAAKVQRQRWEVGRLSMRRKFVGSLIMSDSLTIFQKLMYLLDLFLPSLVSLLLGLLLAGSLCLIRTSDSVFGVIVPWLLLAHGLMAALLLLYVLSPVVVMGLSGRYLWSLLHLPQYALWKLIAMLGPRPSGWVPTARKSSDGPTGELRLPCPRGELREAVRDCRTNVDRSARLDPGLETGGRLGS